MTIEPRIIPLWPDGAPGFEDRKHEREQARDWWVRNVHYPTLTLYRPPARQGNGCAVIVAPGGGFRELVFEGEGKQPAEFLCTLGVSAFALKYRLPDAEGSPYTLQHVREDALRAMRVVRSRADEFGIDPKRIGMLGFSAGGALVTQIAFDPNPGDPGAVDAVERVQARPDFQMLIYPGGAVPEHIPADAPPAFLLCANDDEWGCDRVTLELLHRLRAAGVSVEVHLIARGKHAFNMGDRSVFSAVRGWPERMADWLADSGYLGTHGARSRL